jgi:hypothetical protein
MELSEKDIKRLCKIPTLESFGKAKAKREKELIALPFSEKIKILDAMRQDEIHWNKE